MRSSCDPSKTASIRDDILDIAGTLFYREGIRAVGIDRIVAEANIAKATLYRYFPSKNDLVASYLNARHERVILSLHHILQLHPTPRAQLAAIFDMLFEKADNPDFRGCAFALAVAEHGDSERVVNVARTHKNAVRTLLGAILARAGVLETQPATHVALLYEGALATVAVHHDPQAVLQAKACALSIFDLAIAHAGAAHDTHTA